MSRGTVIGTLALALVGGLLIFAILSSCELRETDKYTGYTGEARVNPMLAARRFLKRMGVPAETVENIQAITPLPSTRDAILIWTQRETLSDERANTLLDWVRNGGHLIVVAREHTWMDDFDFDDEEEAQEQESAPTDTLLDPLGIGSHNVDRQLIDWEDSNVSEIVLPGREKPIEVEFQAYSRLRGAGGADRIVKDELGVLGIHRRIKKGHISVLSDLYFIGNDSIGEHDNAEFLMRVILWREQNPPQNWLQRRLNWGYLSLETLPGAEGEAGREVPRIHKLTGEESGPSKVWLVFNDDMPPLLSWLWHNAAPVMIVSLLMFLTWVAYAAPRFGPVQPVPPPARRRILEHIEAGGYYLWKHRRQARLIQGVREALDKRLRALHPGWAELNLAERERHLSKLCDLPVENVRLILHQDAARNTHEFTRIIQQIEAIRKKL